MDIYSDIYKFASTLCLLLLAGLSPLTAQENSGKTRVKTDLMLSGDSLFVQMTIGLENVPVEPERSLTLTPVLTFPGEGKYRALPPVVINGRRRHKLYQRYLTLNGEAAAGSVSEVERTKNTSGGEILYRTAFPYELWMKYASLDMVEEFCGCAGRTKETSISRLIAVVGDRTPFANEKLVPHLACLQVLPEKLKRRRVETELYLDFPVNTTNILPDYHDNRKELGKATALIEEIQQNNGLTISIIQITGYASPEGSPELNMRLSENRARALCEYLRERLDTPRRLYSVHGSGEHWSGLEEMVRQSDMPYKQEVLDIFAGYTVTGGREGALMRLAGGEPYRYMAREMFPYLRKAVCVCAIDYEVKRYTAEEAGKVMRLHPENLSLSEIFAVAMAGEPGSPEFSEIVALAVRLFPDDPAANLNAAVAAIEKGDIELARKYMEKADPSAAEYMNNYGAMEMLSGNYAKAREWLEKAKGKGSEQAVRNLEELKKISGSPISFPDD